MTETVKVSRSPNDDARGEGSGEGSEYTRLFGLPAHSCVSDVVSVCGRESDDVDPVPVDSEAVVDEL